MDFIETVRSIDIHKYNSAMISTIVDAVRTGDEATRSVFFSSYRTPAYLEPIKQAVQKLSVLYTAFALSQINDKYGFSKIAIDKSILNTWFTDNNYIAGPVFFRGILCDMGLECCYKDKTTWNNIISTMCSKEFIVGLDIDMHTSSRHIVNMLLGAVMAFDAVAAAEVILSWSDIIDVSLFEQIPWFDIFIKFDIISSQIKTDIEKAVYKCKRKNRETHLTAGRPARLVASEFAFYGVEVKEWLNSENGPKKYGISPPLRIANVEFSSGHYAGF